MFFLLLCPMTMEDEGRHHLIRAFDTEAAAKVEIERQVAKSGGWYSRLDFIIAKEV